MSNHKRNRSEKGFTLIELLVVITIVAVVTGLLTPAVQKVRDVADGLSESPGYNELVQELRGLEVKLSQVPRDFYAALAEDVADAAMEQNLDSLDVLKDYCAAESSILELLDSVEEALESRRLSNRGGGGVEITRLRETREALLSLWNGQGTMTIVLTSVGVCP